MKAFLLRWLTTALAIAGAVWLLPGLHFDGGWTKLALVALVFGALNALLKPLLVLLTCPLVLATLGLFLLVLNGVLLLLTARLSGAFGLGFRVDGFWWAVLGGIVIGAASTLISLLLPDPRRTEAAR